MKGNTATKIIRHTDLKGHDWMYNSNTYHVLDVQDNGTLVITDKRQFKFATEEERDYFLANLLPCEELPKASLPAVRKRGNEVIIRADVDSDDIFTQMLGELKCDFDKMKEDPDYVKIAKQRANQVNTMTNLVKTKIQLERLNRG